MIISMGALVLLAVYISFFGVAHSLMAAKGVKNRVYKFLEPQQYRLIYSIVSILLTIPIPVIWAMGRGQSPLIFFIPHPLNLISYLLISFGAAMFVMAAMQNDLFEFLGLNAIFKKKEAEPGLITDGFYAVSRHPMYLFAMLIIWTFPELKTIDLVGNGFITLYFIGGAWLEEQKMIEDYGRKYIEYKQEVSMFIPFRWFMKWL